MIERIEHVVEWADMGTARLPVFAMAMSEAAPGGRGKQHTYKDGVTATES